MTLKKVSLLFHTIKYLKLKQLFYRLYYLLRKKLRKVQGHSYVMKPAPASSALMFSESITLSTSLASFKEYKFTFLNLEHTFSQKIDWNYLDYGKLWTYNLNYFDYLHQSSIGKEDALALMNDFVQNIQSSKDGMMPFPISLRGLNWVKFLSTHAIKDETIDNSLYAQYGVLQDTIEYHILGNHLLENGFSLLFGAYYFSDDVMYAKAYEILISELEEQILDDGAHFELSPMYHQIMLFRVLDSINLIQNNDFKNDSLLSLLTEKASLMLSWLEKISYKNGEIPLLNDSTNGIAPTTKELFAYAKRLNIEQKDVALSDSGYRKIVNDNYEMVVDIGNIGPDYIPGHAHSDTFNFELYLDGKPLIVDRGLSTYESNDLRQSERSTSSHNTVEIDGENQSEVWGGFRVARRAKIVSLEENDNRVKAMHDGYRNRGIFHTREFNTSGKSIKIVDRFIGSRSGQAEAVAYIHFHPDVSVQLNNNIIKANNVEFLFKNEKTISLLEYNYARKFNRTKKSKMIAVTFNKELTMEIRYGK